MADNKTDRQGEETRGLKSGLSPIPLHFDEWLAREYAWIAAYQGNLQSARLVSSQACIDGRAEVLRAYAIHLNGDNPQC